MTFYDSDFCWNASYNANAEKRINDLIQKALDGCDDIFISNNTLTYAIEILNTEFQSHLNDSAQDSIKRINSKLRIQGNILDAYEEMINHIPTEEYYLDLENYLKNV